MATKAATEKEDRTQADIRATNLTDDDRQFIEAHRDALSPSTLSAKWIHSVDEHEDRPGQTLATRSPEVVRAWAEERGGRPATVPGTEHEGRPGVLRITLARQGNGELAEIDWDAWFAPFNERQLVFIYQETTSDGDQSNFFRLDSPEREDA
jgi:hypothetical protein